MIVGVCFLALKRQFVFLDVVKAVVKQKTELFERSEFSVFKLKRNRFIAKNTTLVDEKIKNKLSKVYL